MTYRHLGILTTRFTIINYTSYLNLSLLSFTFLDLW
uniref:Uncharacterized protein n=1 Tax=Amphimedon queenslandica TaxID=400682 RepID=A0A1X7UZ76_AMPQE